MTISSTTPAKRTPIIKIIYGEKLLNISELVLATSEAKSAGNVINVSIFGQTRLLPSMSAFTISAKGLSESELQTFQFLSQKVSGLTANCH